MFSLKWMIPVVCISSAMLAQSASDLNGLVSAASHYVSSGMSGARDPETLALFKVTGDNGSLFPGVLMASATDVQHWNFQYNITTLKPGPGEPAGEAAAPAHLAVQADCTQGVFNNFRYSDTAVTGAKSLEFTWVAVPLEGAIASLNANGYVRGFSNVELLRPDQPGWSDEFVYVFNCPWERREVGISCQTGALAWTYGY